MGDFGRLERTKIASGSASGALERARIVSGRPSRRLERAKIDSGSPLGRVERPKSVLGLRFWSIWGVRKVDFGNFWTLFRSSGLSRSKKRRLAKNLQKLMVFTGFSHVPSCAHALKISRKSIRRRFANASRDRSFAKRASFHVGGRKMNPKSPESRLGRPPGADFGALGGLLGRCGGLLGRSWSALGLSGTALGAVLERSWGALGHS